MLPPELLKVIFEALSRDDLDALMLTNVLFRNINYEFGFPTADNVSCYNNDDFSQRMRLGCVGKLEFEGDYFGEFLFEVLLPLKDAWRLGCIETPINFSCHSMLQRAFSELFFCKDLRVFTNVVGKLRQPFVSLQPVRVCASLFLSTHSTNPLTVAEMVEWLNLDAHSKGPKELNVGDYGLDGGVESCVQQLKTNSESKTPRRYTVKVRQCANDRQPGRFLNKDTSEVLRISGFRLNRTLATRRGCQRQLETTHNSKWRREYSNK